MVKKETTAFQSFRVFAPKRERIGPIVVVGVILLPLAYWACGELWVLLMMLAVFAVVAVSNIRVGRVCILVEREHIAVTRGTQSAVKYSYEEITRIVRVKERFCERYDIYAGAVVVGFFYSYFTNQHQLLCVLAAKGIPMIPDEPKVK